MTRLPHARVALNPIQWFSLKEDASDPDSADLWLIADPAFRDAYPDVLRGVKRAGFDTVMLGVLETQTIQDFERMVTAAGLAVAPGYAAVDVPEQPLPRGSAERVHWFDGVRRKAEESAYFGLDTVFLAPELNWKPASVRATTAAAVGAGFDADRLDRLTDILDEAIDVLAAEGVRAGLHNHVGTWVETVDEIDHVLGAIDPARLGASFDIGHLAWLGVDPVDVVSRYRDRILDLHVKDLSLDVAERSRAVPRPYSWGPSRGLFTDPGEGDLDLDGVLDALPADFGGWIIIEVDLADKDPFDSAVACADWARRALG
ncbi:sugar phosphate isomerase/epimerase [Microbacterium sp. NPDC089189]|uniref:sugar phosphate isomerase/epimerase family protein n=1 Tax=Microbacterium sp. NPDC089189 TaxID=3154972 RepID=UPI00342F774B